MTYIPAEMRPLGVMVLGYLYLKSLSHKDGRGTFQIIARLSPLSRFLGEGRGVRASCAVLAPISECTLVFPDAFPRF